MSGKLSVVIVDDHEAFREGLRQIICDQPGFEVIGEAGDGTQALRLIRDTKPAIAILDVSIPPPDGLAVARSLREEKVPVEIILVTMYREEGILASAYNLHLSYVLKDSATTDITAALEAARNGECFTSPLLYSYLGESGRGATAPMSREESKQAAQDLLPVEQQLVGLIAQYKTSREIAEEMDIRSADVELYRAEICRKLGLAGNHALMKFALNYKTTLS
jgi:two-component system, NarL family, response regulator DegU